MALVQVAQLSQLSLVSLAVPLGVALELELDAEEQEEVRDYLRGAPGTVLQELLQAVLSRFDLEPRVRLSALLLLLRQDVASLSVGMFPEPFHGRLVDAIRTLGPGLHTLDMKGSWLREDDLSTFCSALAQLPGLRALGVPRMATDALLESAGRHCTKLRALDVSGETAITRKGLQELCRPGGPAATLQVLDIGNLSEMNVEPEDIAFLLRSLPRLSSLGSYSHVGLALLALESQEPLEFEQGRLFLEYLHDVDTTPRALSVMLRLCPGLTRVYLDGPAPGVLPQLRLPRLRELKLHQLDVMELLTLLEGGVGEQLESLELVAASGSLNLTRVSALCPRLSQLECYLMHGSHSGTVSWSSLRRLDAFHCSVPGPTLLALALGAPHLTRLAVSSASELTDADASEMCAALPELQELWLADARNLTQIAALCFLTGCPRLRSLGELGGWALDPHQVDELRLLCLQTNLDVVLWYYPST